MSYRWVDHTAELELEITAISEGEVFEQALVALSELLVVDRPEGSEPAGPVDTLNELLQSNRVIRELAVIAPDRAALLAEWLSELVFLSERDGFIPEVVKELDLVSVSIGRARSTYRDGLLTEERVKATVVGRLGAVRHLVKGVTYHHLILERRDQDWHAQVVFDV